MMLDIRDLSVVFTDRGEEKPFTAVDKFSLRMDRGEIVGIVGESGSGKSMTAHALMGLIRRSQVSVTGSALFEGTDLLSLSREELRQYQGRDLSIIFQEPMTSLNPTMRIGKQVEESLRIHERLSPAERKARALEAMALAGLPPPAVRRYAAAGDDRVGSGAAAPSAHRRRTHHGAGRDHPGPDFGDVKGH